jgi:hypothetical protein
MKAEYLWIIYLFGAHLPKAPRKQANKTEEKHP